MYLSQRSRRKKFELECGESFDRELKHLGADAATLIAFGTDVYYILNRLYPRAYNIIKIPHYLTRINKNTYRSAVDPDSCRR